MLGLLASMLAVQQITTRADVLWPDTPAARDKAHELIESFNTRLLEAKTATSALENWCRDHRLAPDPTIRAKFIVGVERPLTADQRRRLQIGESEPVKYRYVALTCGDHVLSEAENWYVPSRLTIAMNDSLANTDVPFGRVVEDLKPVRKTFMIEVLWRPLADQPPVEEAHAQEPAAGLAVPRFVLRHSALVYTDDGAPFAEVRESYTRDILGFRSP